MYWFKNKIRLELDHGKAMNSIRSGKPKEMKLKVNFSMDLIEHGPMRFTDWEMRFKLS